MRLEEEIKSKFRNDYQKAMVNIYYTHCFIHSKFEKLIKKYQITHQQFNILRICRGQYPSAINIGIIKERMLDKNSDVSRIVERLRAKKLLLRKPKKVDRRQMDVKITQSGLDLLTEIDVHDKEMDKILANLTQKEVVLLNNLLDKIRE